MPHPMTVEYPAKENTSFCTHLADTFDKSVNVTLCHLFFTQNRVASELKYNIDATSRAHVASLCPSYVGIGSLLHFAHMSQRVAAMLMEYAVGTFS